MKVWRIENDDGVGPYQAERGSEGWIRVRYELLAEHCPVHCDPFLDEHPSWRCEGFPTATFRSEYYSGFSSLEQLNAWFDCWVDTLSDYGFGIYTYEVSEHHIEIGKSGRQLRFAKDQAKKL